MHTKAGKMAIWLYPTEAKNIRRKKNKKERKPNIAQKKVLGLQPGIHGISQV